MMPERLFKGARYIVEGRVLTRDGPYDLTGAVPYLRLRYGNTTVDIPGSVSDPTGGYWSIPIAPSHTEVFPATTIDYELFLRLPDGSDYVFEQGQIDLVERL